MAYKNFLSVLVHFHKHEYPVSCSLRSGSQVTINSERELWYNMLEEIGLLNGKEFAINFDNAKGLVNIRHTSMDKNYILYNPVNNGDIWGVFLKEEYRNLPVGGRIVVDIGANICDSSLYFVMKGARRIVALEPFPSTYAYAMQNVNSNDLCNIIQLYMAGCGGKADLIYLDSEKGNAISQTNHSVSEGKNVQIMILGQIIKNFDIPTGSVLKIDCEGCEYECILNSTVNELRTFDYIHIEYHYGFRNLKRKLEEAGFRVYLQRPTRWKQRETGKILYTGNILAKLRHHS